MFFEQLEKLCKLNNTTPTAFIKKLGYSSSKITAWKNGSIPKYEILNEISEYFNVPISFLFEEENQIKINKTTETPETLMLLKIYNSLDEKKQHLALQKVLEVANSKD